MVGGVNLQKVCSLSGCDPSITPEQFFSSLQVGVLFDLGQYVSHTLLCVQLVGHAGPHVYFPVHVTTTGYQGKGFFFSIYFYYVCGPPPFRSILAHGDICMCS